MINRIAQRLFLMRQAADYFSANGLREKKSILTERMITTAKLEACHRVPKNVIAEIIQAIFKQYFPKLGVGPLTKKWSTISGGPWAEAMDIFIEKIGIEKIIDTVIKALNTSQKYSQKYNLENLAFQSFKDLYSKQCNTFYEIWLNPMSGRPYAPNDIKNNLIKKHANIINENGIVEINDDKKKLYLNTELDADMKIIEEYCEMWNNMYKTINNAFKSTFPNIRDLYHHGIRNCPSDEYLKDSHTTIPLKDRHFTLWDKKFEREERERAQFNIIKSQFEYAIDNAIKMFKYDDADTNTNTFKCTMKEYQFAQNCKNERNSVALNTIISQLKDDDIKKLIQMMSDAQLIDNINIKNIANIRQSLSTFNSPLCKIANKIFSEGCLKVREAAQEWYNAFWKDVRTIRTKLVKQLNEQRNQFATTQQFIDEINKLKNWLPFKLKDVNTDPQYISDDVQPTKADLKDIELYENSNPNNTMDDAQVTKNIMYNNMQEESRLEINKNYKNQNNMRNYTDDEANETIDLRNSEIDDEDEFAKQEKRQYILDSIEDRKKEKDNEYAKQQMQAYEDLKNMIF